MTLTTHSNNTTTMYSVCTDFLFLECFWPEAHLNPKGQQGRNHPHVPRVAVVLQDEREYEGFEHASGRPATRAPHLPAARGLLFRRTLTAGPGTTTGGLPPCRGPSYVKRKGQEEEYEAGTWGRGRACLAGPERRSASAEVRCFDTKICAQSGKGGDGQVSFRREKYVPRGGPDGGNGGRGGHVWVVATKGLNSLSSFRNQIHFRAKKGGNGMGRNCAGAAGEDVEVKVPIGTIIRRAGVLDGDTFEQSAAGGEGAGAAGGFGYADVTADLETLTFDGEGEGAFPSWTAWI